MVVSSIEDVSTASLLYLHGINIEYSDKQDKVLNISFEEILPSIKKYFFHQRMIDFVNKLDLNDQKYQTNGNLRY